MFPGYGAEIYRNEDGEVLGWDYPADPVELYYCDLCGISHGGECQWDDEDEWDEDQYLIIE